MRVAFIHRGYESLGVEYISAYLQRAGHQTALIFDPSLFELPPFMHKGLARMSNRKNSLIERIAQFKPDLIGFSVVSDDYGWACDIAACIKKKMDVPIIFGGVHPSSVPGKVLKEDFVDYVCVGEGEDAVLELVESLNSKGETKSIANIWCKDSGGIIENPPRSLIADLDSLPFPDKDIFYREHNSLVNEVYTIAASRGCQYRCNFCFNSYMGQLYKNDRNYLRRRSVDNVIEELKLAKEKYRTKSIFFTDDSFISDSDWLKEFSSRYKTEINLPFTCLVHPSFVNQEVIKCLAGSKCRVVGMGIQSIDEQLRKNVLSRPGSNEDIKQAIELFSRTNIYFYVDMILGLPYQEEAELVEAVKFLNKHRPDAVATLWLRYYPGIKIVEKALKEGILSLPEVEKIESSKAYEPLAIRGNTFDSKLGKLGNLMLLVPLLPKKLVLWMLNKKIYKYLPSSTSMHLHLNSRVMFLWKRLFAGKRGYSYRSVMWYLRYYFYYLSHA